MTITDRMAAWRRERRVLLRVPRAAWRLEHAERERAWPISSATVTMSTRTTVAGAIVPGPDVRRGGCPD
ncbi:MAG: hypothetical protein ACRDOL_19440, partial [Streptosporangiaceae bacterium]